MTTKLSDKMASRFLGGCLIALEVLNNVKKVLAGENAGWQEPIGEPAGGMMSLAEAIPLFLKKWVVTPLALIGVAVYALAFWYKLVKKDQKRLKKTFKFGTLILLLAGAVWLLVVYFFTPLSVWR